MVHHRGVCCTPDFLVTCRSFYVLLISPLFSNMADGGALRDSEL